MNDDHHVEELLIRGRPKGWAQPLAWHVIIGTVSRDALGQEHVVNALPISATEAEKRGFPLSDIAGSLNAELMIEVERLKQRIAELEERNSDTLFRRDLERQQFSDFQTNSVGPMARELREKRALLGEAVIQMAALRGMKPGECMDDLKRALMAKHLERMEARRTATTANPASP